MTLAKARNLVKLDKNTKNGKIAVSMVKNPPPDLNFYQNKKQRQIEPLPEQSRSYRNSLSLGQYVLSRFG